MSEARRDLTYDPVTRWIHWLNAILVAVTIALAWGITGAPRHGAARAWLIALHGSCGIVVLAAMLFWGGWRLRHMAPLRRPVLRASETLLARATQGAIFLLFGVMPLTGYVSLAAAGVSLPFFGLVDLPLLAPQSARLSQLAIALHLAGEFLIYGLVAIHVAAALLHGMVRRDGTLERMLPPRG